MGYIYLRKNLINGKCYVGQVIKKRFKKRQSVWNNLNRPYAGKAINTARAKYGLDAFDFEILKECEDEELNQWEMYYIKEYNSKTPNGYNMTDGGDSTYERTEETRKKMSDAHRGKKHSPEHVTKVAAAKSKAVQALDPTTMEVVMEFPSTREAERQGFDHRNISACCRNCYSTHKGNVYKGFIWRFKEKNEHHKI